MRVPVSDKAGLWRATLWRQGGLCAGQQRQKPPLPDQGGSHDCCSTPKTWYGRYRSKSRLQQNEASGQDDGTKRNRHTNHQHRHTPGGCSAGCVDSSPPERVPARHGPLIEGAFSLRPERLDRQADAFLEGGPGLPAELGLRLRGVEPKLRTSPGRAAMSCFDGVAGGVAEGLPDVVDGDAPARADVVDAAASLSRARMLARAMSLT
jgi:hypothetical protein